MKLGFSTVACPNWHLQRISECTKEYGFDGVELRVHADNRHFSPYATLSAARLIGRVFKRDGTPIFSLKAGLPLSFRNRTDIVEGRDEILNILKFAEVMGAPFVRITLADSPVDDVSDYNEMLLSVLKPLSDSAIERGVKLGIETDNTWSNAALFKPILERADELRGVGIIYNAFNCFNAGRESWTETYAALGPYICYCKVTDGFVNVDGSVTYCLLGTGELPIRRILRRFQLDGYGGYFSFDWRRMFDSKLDRAEDALPHFAQTMRSIWAIEQRKTSETELFST